MQQAKEDERNKRKCQKHWWRRKGGQTWSPVEQTAMQSQPRLWGKGRWDKLQNSLTWRLISKFIYKAGSSLCLSDRFNVYRASKSLHYTKGGKTLGCHCDSSYSGRLNGKASGWHFCQISKSPQLAPHVEEWQVNSVKELVNQSMRETQATLLRKLFAGACIHDFNSSIPTHNLGWCTAAAERHLMHVELCQTCTKSVLLQMQCNPEVIHQK